VVVVVHLLTAGVREVIHDCCMRVRLPGSKKLNWLNCEYWNAIVVARRSTSQGERSASWNCS